MGSPRWLKVGNDWHNVALWLRVEFPPVVSTDGTLHPPVECLVVAHGSTWAHEFKGADMDTIRTYLEQADKAGVNA